MDSEALYLWRTYRSDDPGRMSARYRNTHTDEIVRLADETGKRLLQIIDIPTCRVVLGGSFGYDASLAGSYDLDLRLLLPALDDEEIKRVSALVERDIPFDRVIVARESGEHIYHHINQVSLEGVPQPVKLSLNIQSAKNYFGIAEMARALPGIVRDRYVAARGRAEELGVKADAAAIKQHWYDMILWLEQHGMCSAAPGEIPGLLKQAESFFPLFLKEGTTI